MGPRSIEATRLSKRALFQLLGYEPHEGQLLVHRSKALRRILCCGARWGKSRCAAMEACAALLEPRPESLGWVVAPTRDLVDRIFLRVVDTLKARLPHRVVEVDLRSQRLVIANLGGGRSELRGKSADVPVTLLGEEIDFVIVDEAARLREDIWPSFLSQRLVNRNGWALLLSTPTGSGWFHQLYRRGIRKRDPEFESWSFPSWMNPHLDRAIVEAERERLPADVFAQEYGGEFVGVDPEPCERCLPVSPKACQVIYLREWEKKRRCPECDDLVDAEGRTLVPPGAKWMRILWHRDDECGANSSQPDSGEPFP
jgi:hypothetical protein